MSNIQCPVKNDISYFQYTIWEIFMKITHL